MKSFFDLAPLEIVTDNGTENVNQTVKHTLEIFKVKHITPSVAPPQSNSVVECFHRNVHDVMSKRLDENYETLDLYCNQVSTCE